MGPETMPQLCHVAPPLPLQSKPPTECLLFAAWPAVPPVRTMFRKLKSQLGGKGSKVKIRLDVAVARVEGLPPALTACRLQWARGAKVAVTKLVPASEGGSCSLLSKTLENGTAAVHPWN